MKFKKENASRLLFDENFEILKIFYYPMKNVVFGTAGRWRLSCRLHVRHRFPCSTDGWSGNVQQTRITSVKNNDIVPFAYTPVTGVRLPTVTAFAELYDIRLRGLVGRGTRYRRVRRVEGHVICYCFWRAEYFRSRPCRGRSNNVYPSDGSLEGKIEKQIQKQYTGAHILRDKRKYIFFLIENSISVFEPDSWP